MLFGQNSRRDFFKAITAFLGVGASDSKGPDDHRKSAQNLYNETWSTKFDSPDFADNTVQSVDDLRSVKPDPNRVILVKGYNTAGDGGGGLFWWKGSADAATANGGTTIASTVTDYTDGDEDEGLWKRVYSGNLHPAYWGAKGDNVTDDRAAIQSAIDAAQGSETQTVDLEGKNYAISSANPKKGAYGLLLRSRIRIQNGKLNAQTRNIDYLLGADGREDFWHVEDLGLNGNNNVKVPFYAADTLCPYSSMESLNCGAGTQAAFAYAGFVASITDCRFANSPSGAIIAHSDGGGGFDFNGTLGATSLNVSNSYAIGCDTGWEVGWVTYSNFEALASDKNGLAYSVGRAYGCNMQFGAEVCNQWLSLQFARHSTLESAQIVRMGATNSDEPKISATLPPDYFANIRSSDNLQIQPPFEQSRLNDPNEAFISVDTQDQESVYVRGAIPRGGVNGIENRTGNGRVYIEGETLDAVGRYVTRISRKVEDVLNEDTYADLIDVQRSSTPSTAADSAVLDGKLELVIAARGSRGVRYQTRAQYQVFVDADYNKTFDKKNEISTSETSDTLSFTVKWKEGKIQIKVTSNSNSLTRHQLQTQFEFTITQNSGVTFDPKYVL